MRFNPLLALLFVFGLAPKALALNPIRLFGYDDHHKAIVVYSNQPLQWKSMQLAHRDRFVVDLPGSVYLGHFSQLSAIPQTTIQSVRIGQFEPSTVRLVLDLKSPTRFPIDQQRTPQGLYRLMIKTEQGTHTAPPKNHKAPPIAKSAPQKHVSKVAHRPDDLPDDDIVLKRMGPGWQMILKANEAVKYHVGRLSGDDRLYLDIIGGSFNLPPDSVYVDNGIIARIRVGKQDSKTTRLVLDIDQPVKPSVKLAPNHRAIIISLAPKVDTRHDEERVTVDPGHGGNDSGARGRYLQEKMINLQVALRVQRRLEQDGINVQLTRRKDVEVMLRPRVDMGNRNGSDCFVSIHANSFRDGSVSGIETYYYNPSSLPLARAVHHRMIKLLKRPDRGIHRNNFVVVKYNNMPACLVEIGYLSNSKDEALLADRNYQEKVAQAISAGVKDYLKSRGKKG